MIFNKIASIFDNKSEDEKSLEDVYQPPEESIFDIEESEIEQVDIYDELSEDLGVEKELIKAFIKVEAGGQNFVDDRVIARWETHIFERKTNITVKVHGKRGRINKECQDNEWEALGRGLIVEDGKHRDSAYESASYGIGQIMGFHFKRLGFSNAEELVNYISESKENGLRSIAKFIKTDKRLLKACREKNYHLIATYYNGKYYKKYANGGKTYADKIEEEYNRLISFTVTSNGNEKISL